MNFFRLSLAFLLLAAAPAQAQQADAEMVPAPQVSRFYARYIHTLNRGKIPWSDDRANLKQNLSTRFLKQIDKLSSEEGGLEADPLLDAQDFDKAWEKNIEVLAVSSSEVGATVDLALKGPEMGRYVLRVRLVSERGGYKIDGVEHREPKER